MRTWFFLAMMALVGAAPPPNKFDLECSGTKHGANQSDEPYSEHYRVDLGARRWCMAACRVVKHIAEVQPAMILLEESNESGFDFKHFLDREKGRDLILSSDPPMTTSGECKRLPFSGFAKFKTKF